MFEVLKDFSHLGLDAIKGDVLPASLLPPGDVPGLIHKGLIRETAAPDEKTKKIKRGAAQAKPPRSKTK